MNEDLNQEGLNPLSAGPEGSCEPRPQADEPPVAVAEATPTKAIEAGTEAPATEPTLPDYPARLPNLMG